MPAPKTRIEQDPADLPVDDDARRGEQVAEATHHALGEEHREQREDPEDRAAVDDHQQHEDEQRGRVEQRRVDALEDRRGVRREARRPGDACLERRPGASSRASRGSRRPPSTSTSMSSFASIGTFTSSALPSADGIAGAGSPRPATLARGELGAHLLHRGPVLGGRALRRSGRRRSRSSGRSRRTRHPASSTLTDSASPGRKLAGSFCWALSNFPAKRAERRDDHDPDGEHRATGAVSGDDVRERGHREGVRPSRLCRINPQARERLCELRAAASAGDLGREVLLRRAASRSRCSSRRSQRRDSPVPRTAAPAGARPPPGAEQATGLAGERRAKLCRDEMAVQVRVVVDGRAAEVDLRRPGVRRRARPGGGGPGSARRAPTSGCRGRRPGRRTAHARTSSSRAPSARRGRARRRGPRASDSSIAATSRRIDPSDADEPRRLAREPAHQDRDRPRSGSGGCPAGGTAAQGRTRGRRPHARARGASCPPTSRRAARSRAPGRRRRGRRRCRRRAGTCLRAGTGRSARGRPRASSPIPANVRCGELDDVLAREQRVEIDAAGGRHLLEERIGVVPRPQVVGRAPEALGEPRVGRRLPGAERGVRGGLHVCERGEEALLGHLVRRQREREPVALAEATRRLVAQAGELSDVVGDLGADRLGRAARPPSSSASSSAARRIARISLSETLRPPTTPRCRANRDSTRDASPMIRCRSSVRHLSGQHRGPQQLELTLDRRLARARVPARPRRRGRGRRARPRGRRRSRRGAARAPRSPRR